MTRARKCPAGTQPGFDDAKWEPAILAAENGSVPAMFYEYRESRPTGRCRWKMKGHPRWISAFKRPPKLEAFPGVPVRPVRKSNPSPSPRRPMAFISSTWDRISPGWSALESQRPGGHADSLALRRDAISRRPADDRKSAQGARHGPLCFARRPERRNVRAALHLPRLSICRS